MNNGKGGRGTAYVSLGFAITLWVSSEFRSLTSQKFESA